MTKYARSMDAQEGALGPAHRAMLAYVRDRSSVLDIGCSSGYLARALVERGCTVVGVELNAADAELARAWCTLVISGDIEAASTLRQLRGMRFDAVLLGDVLEHLRDPEPVLAQTAQLLQPGGRAIVSIPNVAHASIRLQLLLGGFWYTPVGLLDDTHLRFFTFETFCAMAARAEFEVLDVSRVEEPVNPDLLAECVSRLELGAEAAQRLTALLHEPAAATFQYVMQLAPGREHSGVQPVERPVWARTLTEYLAGRDRVIDELQSAVAEQTAWAQDLAEQVAKRDKIIGELQSAIGEQTAWAQSAVDQVRERDTTILRLQQAIERDMPLSQQTTEGVADSRDSDSQGPS